MIGFQAHTISTPIPSCRLLLSDFDRSTRGQIYTKRHTRWSKERNYVTPFQSHLWFYHAENQNTSALWKKHGLVLKEFKICLINQGNTVNCDKHSDTCGVPLSLLFSLGKGRKASLHDIAISNYLLFFNIAHLKVISGVVL